MFVSREELVAYTETGSLYEFLNILTAELRLRTLAGHRGRFEIITGATNPSQELTGAGGVTVLVRGEDERVEHIYTCTYRGLFSDSVFSANQTKQRFYEQFHMWVSRGKLQQLLQIYLSGTAETELENALGRIECALIDMAKEGNLLLGNIELISRTRQEIQYVMEETTKFVDEQMFVGYAERVRENLVKAKLCMFCKVLTEMMSTARSVGGFESGGENGRPAD